jgi:putative ABC transport system permease protein
MRSISAEGLIRRTFWRGTILAQVRVEVDVDGWWQDMRFAIRLLRRNPRNTVIAAAILALGIGANTALFSAINHLLLRPLPFKDSDRLVRVRDAVAGADGVIHPFNMSGRNVEALRAHTEIFDAVVAFSGSNMTLLGGDAPERVSVVFQSEGHDRTFGIVPVIGRGFSAVEQRQGIGSGVALASYALWQNRFGGSPNVLGTTIRLDTRELTLIGVMPPGYAFPYDAQVWAPTTIDPASSTGNYAVFAHMRPGVTLSQVRTALPAVAAEIRARFPDTWATYSFDVLPLRESLLDNQDGPIRALSNVVLFVLLTACVNVATLLLARSVTRRREFAIRAILGASAARHVRQLLAESLVLAGLGCGAGLLLAEWLSPITANLIPSDISQQLGLATLHTDWRVGGFAVGASLFSAIVAGFIPALGSWNTDSQAALSEGGRTIGGGRGGTRLLGALIVCETALTLVLLAGAGLVMQNFARLRSADLGFPTRGLLTLSLNPSPAAYPPGAARAELVRRIVEQIESTPGVAAAGVTTVNPIGGGTVGAAVVTEASLARDPNAVFNINHRLITPRLLDTMGIRLRRGRAFTAFDRDGTQPVAIVSAQLAERLWPGEDAVGQRLRVSRADAPWVTVVGVAENVRDSHEPGVPIETWYLPFDQQAMSGLAARFYVMVRADGDPLPLVTPVQRAIWRVDKTLAPYRVSSMDAYYGQSIARERLGAGFMFGLAAFGLALAMLGVYGVMAFSVAQRTAEIGVRMALGARAADILPLVMRRGVLLIAAGVAVGTIAAVWLNRLMAGVLTEVRPLDAGVLAGAALLILTAAVIACIAPALRAARLDPVVALRND